MFKGVEYNKAEKVIHNVNAKIKRVRLLTNLFHHQAYIRSYLLGVPMSEGMTVDPMAAYKEGLGHVKGMDPIVRLLVNEGMTLGRNQEYLEQTPRTAVGRAVSNFEHDLFSKLGAGLKTKAAIIEMRDLMRHHPNMDVREAAKIAANYANADFGGLNLKLLGISERQWKHLRLTMLAPDWTTSNVVTATKAVMPIKKKTGKGFEKDSIFRASSKVERQVYQKFWGRALLRGMTATYMMNMMLTGWDEEQYEKNLKAALKAGHLRSMEVDITPISRLLGQDKRRRYFNLSGHFKDPIKWIHSMAVKDMLEPMKHKASAATGILLNAVTHKDWRGANYTDTAGLMKSGEFTSFKRKLAPDKYSPSQLPSFIGDTIRTSLPVGMQQLGYFIDGEIGAFDALFKSLGFMTSVDWKGKK
jgi:hypothetical protein